MQGSRSMRPQGLLWSWKLQTLQADTTSTSWREQCLFSWTASLTNTESTNVLDKDTYVSRKIILSFLSLLSLSFVGILLLHFFCIFNWNIVALHCCVTFYWSMKWISYMYTYILSLLDLPPTLSHPTLLALPSEVYEPQAMLTSCSMFTSLKGQVMSAWLSIVFLSSR